MYGRLRLGLFAATTAGAWVLLAAGRGTTAWFLVAAAVLTFAFLVGRHRIARRHMHRAELMAAFNREGIARVGRRWSELPDPPITPPSRNHDYADDLDLHGHASLLHLVGVCGTAPGRQTMQRWLLEGADPETIALRQEAVREMAGAYGFRDRLVAEARMMKGGGEGDGTDGFLAWAEGEAWLDRRLWVRAVGIVLPVVNLAATVLYSLGVVPLPALVWPLLASTLLYTRLRKGLHRDFDEADDGESGVRRFAPLLAVLVNAPLESAYAVEIRRRLGADPAGSGTRKAAATAHPRPAHHEITTLRRLLDLADTRRSPLFHLPLAVVLLWDVHVLAALERWRARSGPRVRDWLKAAGEAEALAALAALASDHPDWAFPVVDPATTTLRGEAVGHPLLAPDACVPNDVEVGPAGSFLLVTGSNMSGKSTLLKAVGLNAVLTQAGAPVRARSLRMPPLRIVTSMHVEDSVVDGVSYFMAGLHRLKHVVDVARRRPDPAHPAIAPPAGPPPDGSDGKPTPVPHTLYLLDEILQGTNTTERRIAARTVLRHLLATGAIGAVTTHDLTLADAEDLTRRAVAVHFTESVGDGDEGITFDYRLRNGIATSTNALRLLELVGLGDGDGPKS